MTIEILGTTTDTDETGAATGRTATFIIGDGQAAYLYVAGGLALEGDLQALLEAREAELWREAQAAGRLVLPEHRAVVDFRNLPNWATWTGQQAADALRIGILNGMTKAEARAAIDAQFAGVTNLAQLGAATVAILKTLADAVIDGRDLGHVNEAKAIMWLRDISVR